MPNEIQVRSVLNKTKGRGHWFLDDYTINPYSGCSFNCLFCYIRGSKYGTHMEEKIGIKINALEVLEKQLHNRAKKGQYGIIVLASATDPYLHFEKEYQLTRGILELILKYRFPVHMITRSDLILRDMDLLHQINREGILPGDLAGKLEHKTLISFSFSTTDDTIARIFEPGAPAPSTRLETIRTLLKEGFHTGVNLMPLLPYITDTGEHWENMMKQFSETGIRYTFPATLTLFGDTPSDSKTLVLRAISKHYPHLLEKYHRFFDRSEQMPAYYQKAFYRKTIELCERYGIPNTILGERLKNT